MRPALAFLVVVALLLVAGCGGGEDVRDARDRRGLRCRHETTETTTTASRHKGDAAAGKTVFASAGCGGCHTLADAGTNGSIGPNLDDAQPDYALVVERVTNGQGAMPSFKGQLTETQIQTSRRTSPRPPGPSRRPVIDLRAARSDPDGFRAALARRGVADEFDELLAADERWRELVPRVDELRSARSSPASRRPSRSRSSRPSRRS